MKRIIWILVLIGIMALPACSNKVSGEPTATPTKQATTQPTVTFVMEKGGIDELLQKYKTEGIVEINAYVKPVDNKTVELDDIVIVSLEGDNGPEIDNKDESYKQYAVADDVKIFKLEDEAVSYVSITMESLKTDIETAGNKMIYYVYLKDDKVKYLFEYYMQ